MMELCLPSGVVVVEAFDDVPGEPVFPGEGVLSRTLWRSDAVNS